MQGKFITIEGIEGAGKSTALQFIQHYLTSRQLSFVITREPGGTPFAEKIRDLLLHEMSETIFSDTELLLMFAARAQHIQQVILPALLHQQIVVSDRYIDASYAYQGGGRQMAMEKIKILDELIVGTTQPDLTILLDISVSDGIARAAKRNRQKDRIEQETIDFFERVRGSYLTRAKENSARIKIVDASMDLDAVQTQIRMILDQFIG